MKGSGWWMMGLTASALVAFGLGCGDSDTGADTSSTDTATDTGNDATEDTAAASELAASYDLTSDTLFPEGIAYDSVQRRFLVGSLSEATITSVSPDGTEAVFAATQRTDWMTLGLAADEQARVLWACARHLTDTALPAELWRYDLDSGEALAAAELSAAAADASCNDVTLGRAGGVFVSDPASARVFEVDAEGVATVLVADDALAAQIPGLGPNGLVVTPDGETLIVAVFSPASLFAVPLADPSALTEITLDAELLTAGGPFAGPDGLFFFEGDLLVVTSGQVLRVALDAQRVNGAISVAADGLNALSTGAVADGAAYVVKSDPVASVTGSAPDLPFQILRVLPAP